MTRGAEVQPRILGVAHVAVLVQDAHAAAAAFARAFGLAGGRMEVLPGQGVTAVFHPLAGATRIEFISPLSGEGKLASYLARRGPGLHHVALQVAGLDALVARFRARGVEVITPAAAGAGGRRVAFLHPRSTGGVLIEFVESENRGHDGET